MGAINCQNLSPTECTQAEQAFYGYSHPHEPNYSTLANVSASILLVSAISLLAIIITSYHTGASPHDRPHHRKNH